MNENELYTENGGRPYEAGYGSPEDPEGVGQYPQEGAYQYPQEGAYYQEGSGQYPQEGTGQYPQEGAYYQEGSGQYPQEGAYYQEGSGQYPQDGAYYQEGTGQYPQEGAYYQEGAGQYSQEEPYYQEGGYEGEQPYYEEDRYDDAEAPLEGEDLAEDDLYYKRKEIIEVARYLYDIGLIVRTWGNVSARIDSAHFLITPSGIRYEDLTPEMIPLVKIKNLAYKGDYSPSSESKVHAACYKARPECTFIVHTHQVFASCAGALGMKKILTYFDNSELIIPVVPYGYPGTEKLADNVGHTLKRFKDVNSLIMANHGTVCLGGSSREAVYEAQRMEIACNDFLIDVCNMNMTHGVEVGFNSHLEGEKIVYDTPDTPERVKQIHEQIYAVRKDIKYIVHNKSEAVVLVSRRANHMRPLLDDFAQLIGTSVNIPKNEGEIYHNIRKTVNVVFSPNDGAYCLGPTEDDAQAVALVLDKGCIAYTAVLRNGEGHYVPTLECILMNRNYRKNYSKLADKVEASDNLSEEEAEDARYEQYYEDAEYADEFDAYEEDNGGFVNEENWGKDDQTT